jgi:hypothetical protein
MPTFYPNPWQPKVKFQSLLLSQNVTQIQLVYCKPKHKAWAVGNRSLKPKLSFPTHLFKFCQLSLLCHETHQNTLNLTSNNLYLWTLQSSATLNKVHCALFFPTSPHNAPWLELCNSEAQAITQQTNTTETQVTQQHICCTLGPTKACLPKQATYQSGATANKVHCSLSSPTKALTILHG